MQEAAKETAQHLGLGVRISSVPQVVFLRKDKLFEGACSTLFGDLFGEEGDVALVETWGRFNSTIRCGGEYDTLLFIPQVVNEILFSDGSRRVERRALNVAIAFIVISDDRRGST